MSEFKPLRSFEDRFTVKKTLEFGGCKLYAGVVRLNLDEKLLEASRVEFARGQAAAFVVAPNHLTDLTMLADEGHEVTALGNGDSEQAFGNGGQTQKAGTQINGGNDDGEVRVGEIHLHDAVPDTEFFFIAQLSCAMKTAGLPICISKRNPPGKKTDKAPEQLRELAATSVPTFSA